MSFTTPAEELFKESDSLPPSPLLPRTVHGSPRPIGLLHQLPVLPAITSLKMLPFPDSQNFVEQNHHPLKPEHSNFFVVPFSPSNVNSDDLHDMLSTHLILPSAASMASALQPLPSTLPSNVVSSMANTTRPMRSSRAAVRKERHSKILTAMGPRDRRMRLSLEVARKFFNLQDRLGFDKASKTVQWLLTTSNVAIEKLRAASRPGDRAFMSNESHRNESSTSECEDVSTVSDRKGKSSRVVVASGEAKRPSAKRAKHPRKAAFHPNIARENRARARARARERTREKKWMSSAMSKDGGNQWASSSLPLVPIEEESSRHDLKASLDLVAEVDQERCSSMPNQHDQHFNERGPEVPLEGGSLPISIFDYGHNMIMSINDTISIFQEQWDMERILLADAQSPPRPWVAFNNSPIG